ncbi:sorting and assembly machinery component 50 [Desmophyllum pertusum]|uniref:Sorting and assembly machinery component 50 n=1 Tax=Desmophyllum pertusum TaxID=174260 RepID=A0A9W9YNG0_9CNID|nr:sorting and assembly machinery component 50 [Desmophyllum pertusum]
MAADTAVICGAYARVCGAYAGVCGAYARVCGAYAGVCGAYAGVCGAYARVCGAYAGVCGAYARHMLAYARHMLAYAGPMRGVCGAYAGICGCMRCMRAHAGICGCAATATGIKHSLLLELAFEAKDNLANLGVFHEVDMLIDTSSDHSAHPNGYDVTFHVKEKRLLTSSTGTQIGNNGKATCCFGCRLNNVCGRAEKVRADVSFGTKTRMSYQLAFFKPTPGTPERSFPPFIGQHWLSWEGSWREVTGLARNASFEIREQAGHSLRHTIVVDKRDNMALPSEGYLLKLAQELAGLGGDVRFLKHNLEYQHSVELLKDVILSWSFQGGNLRPLFGTPSRINDRFFLGGPLSVRGFGTKGIGPRSENDSLGADAYWAAGLHLYTPLPFRPGRGGLIDNIKTHFFFNTGNLASLDTSLPWRNRLDVLREKIRWSCGAGLVFMLGIARVELNYCVPFGAQNSDSVNHGIQVGVGINFL